MKKFLDQEVNMRSTQTRCRFSNFAQHDLRIPVFLRDLYFPYFTTFTFIMFVRLRSWIGMLAKLMKISPGFT